MFGGTGRLWSINLKALPHISISLLTHFKLKIMQSRDMHAIYLESHWHDSQCSRVRIHYSSLTYRPFLTSQLASRLVLRQKSSNQETCMPILRILLAWQPMFKGKGILHSFNLHALPHIFTSHSIHFETRIMQSRDMPTLYIEPC